MRFLNLMKFLTERLIRTSKMSCDHKLTCFAERRDEVMDYLQLTPAGEGQPPDPPVQGSRVKIASPHPVNITRTDFIMSIVLSCIEPVYAQNTNFPIRTK